MDRRFLGDLLHITLRTAPMIDENSRPTPTAMAQGRAAFGRDNCTQVMQVDLPLHSEKVTLEFAEMIEIHKNCLDK
jgi:hypothetical protein